MDYKKNKGFTLIELILSAMILVIVIGIIMSSLRMVQTNLFGSHTEFEYQSLMREAVNTIKTKIETTKAAYVLNDDDFYSGSGGSANPKPHWDYYVLSEDGRKLLYYQYNPETENHDISTVLEAKEGQSINVEFTKKIIDGLDESKQLHTKYLTFRYVIIDENGSEIRAIETEVEAKNAFKVEDERSDLDVPSHVLSFRSVTNGNDDPIVFITMVVDTSTSMTYDINGNPTSSDNSRFTLLKRALNGYDSATHHTGLLEKFATSENLFVTLIPYANTANHPEQLKYKYYEQGIIGYEKKYVYFSGYGWRLVDDLSRPIYGDVGEAKYSDQDHPTYLMHSTTEYDAITDEVDDIDIFIGAESAGTNTGDGIRRAYYAHESISQTLAQKGIDTSNRRVLEYLIVLLDGNVTFSTWNGYGAPGGNYKLTDGPATDVTVSFYNNPESTYTEPCILGKGSDISTLTDRYVQQIGNLIKRRNIKSFVIGFTSQVDERQSLSMIANSIGSEQVYEYSDDFNLEAIFDDIYNKINIDLWILQGPHD